MLLTQPKEERQQTQHGQTNISEHANVHCHGSMRRLDPMLKRANPGQNVMQYRNDYHGAGIRFLRPRRRMVRQRRAHEPRR